MTETAQRVARKIRRVLGIKQLPELDQRLAQMERIFHAPPLTSELIAAIKLISPHCDLAPSEGHRLVWEADQNGACWGEYELRVVSTVRDGLCSCHGEAVHSFTGIPEATVSVSWGRALCRLGKNAKKSDEGAPRTLAGASETPVSGLIPGSPRRRRGSSEAARRWRSPPVDGSRPAPRSLSAPG